MNSVYSPPVGDTGKRRRVKSLKSLTQAHIKRLSGAGGTEGSKKKKEIL